MNAQIQTDQRPVITLTEFEANRLTFTAKGRSYIYDARGYEFVRYPKTGDALKEPKSSPFHPSTDTGILFRAYDDSGSKFFSFCHADCFDPAMHLICADSFESAYDIFLDEFAQTATDSDFPGEAAKEAALNNGVCSYSSGGRFVYSENVQGFEMKLIKAESL